MHSIGRKCRAARILGGYGSTEELAEALDVHGLGARNLRKTEAGERELAPHERAAIAHACALDPLFFELDLGDLHPAPAAAELADTLRRAAQRLEEDASALAEVQAAAAATIRLDDPTADKRSRARADKPASARDTPAPPADSARAAAK